MDGSEPNLGALWADDTPVTAVPYRLPKEAFIALLDNDAAFSHSNVLLPKIKNHAHAVGDRLPAWLGLAARRFLSKERRGRPVMIY